MKRMVFAALLLAVIGTMSGCRSCDRMFSRRGMACSEEGCSDGSCAGSGPRCRTLLGRRGRGDVPDAGSVADPGPPSGQVAYPYYTTHGPRDFLLDNPPSLGP